MSDYTKLIEKWIQEDESLIIPIMNIAAQLYRENGLQEIQFRNVAFTKGDLLFSDQKWDELKKKTKFVEPKMNASSRPKVKQLYSFGTLEKFTKKNLDKYQRRIDKIDGIKELILLPKYDGIGMRVYYGEMFLTRYDKIYGLDISYKTKHLFSKFNIPKNSILRGELITLKEHDGYATKRHYVSAMIGNEDILPDDIIFVCYEYLEMNERNEINQLSFEQMLNKIYKIFKFKHTAIKIDKKILSSQVIEDFEKEIPTQYKTDGVVIRPNEKEYTFEDREKPSYQVAFKFDVEQFKGKVKEIEWSVKQQGFLQPTIILQEVVVIDKTNIQRANGVNFNFLFQQNLYPKQECFVSLKIVSRIEGLENQKLSKEEFSNLIQPKCCPNCGGEIEIVENSVERFKCKDFYKNKCFLSIIIMRAKEFLGIKKLGEKGLMKLIKEKDFDFMQWIKQYNPTNKQLFLILSDNINVKKVDQIYTKELLNELLKQYGF